MIVKVRFEVSDDERRAIRKSMGRAGLATRLEIASMAELGLRQGIDAAVESYSSKTKEPR